MFVKVAYKDTENAFYYVQVLESTERSIRGYYILSFQNKLSGPVNIGMWYYNELQYYKIVTNKRTISKLKKLFS